MGIPQQLAVPSRRTPQEWSEPAETARYWPVTRFTLDPTPPLHRTSKSGRSPHTWESPTARATNGPSGVRWAAEERPPQHCGSPSRPRAQVRSPHADRLKTLLPEGRADRWKKHPSSRSCDPAATRRSDSDLRPQPCRALRDRDRPGRGCSSPNSRECRRLLARSCASRKCRWRCMGRPLAWATAGPMRLG